jgi:hypothetical protein
MSKKFLAMRLQKKPQLEVDYGFGRPSYIDIHCLTDAKELYMFSAISKQQWHIMM